MLEEFNAATPVPKPRGFTEKDFRAAWIHLLSGAMLKSGKGFRMDSPKRKPPKGAAKWRGERRADKVGTTKAERQLLTGGGMKRDMLTVVDARPPNFDKIVAVLPEAAQPGVMFAYDGKVYFPGARTKVLTRELDSHESVHIERQKHDGLDAWWEKYLTDVNFRFNEELLAHRAEYRTYCKRHINPIKRYQFLRFISKRLASPLYAAGLTDERAAIEIQFGDAA